MLTLTMFSVLTRFLGLLYKIYLSRIMSTTELGVYNLTLSVYMVIITLVTSSIPLTISKITSSNISLKKEHETRYSVTSSLILSIIVSIVLVILTLSCKPLLILIIGNELGFNIIVSLIPSIIFSAMYSQIRGYLWGYENYYAVSIVEFVEQILRIAFCFVFIMLDVFESPAVAVGTALSIACGLSSLYGYYLYFKNGGKFKFKKGYYKEIIQSSLPLTGVRLFNSLTQPITAVLITFLLTTFGHTRDMALSELGVVMGMSLPIISIPSTIIGSLCMILIPRITSCTNNTQNRLKIQIDNYIKFSIICLFLFLPIFIALGIPLCSFIFDNTQAGLYLSNCAWIIIPMGISQITTSILNALNQEKKTFIYFVISSIFMFISIIILSKFIGVMSMAYSMGISCIIQSILNIKKIKKITGYTPKIISTLTQHLMITLPIILISKLTYNWINILAPKIITIIICCTIAVLSYISLLFVFNVFNFKQLKQFIVNNLKFRKNKKQI